MHEFSTVDGFVEISDCLAEMIKYVANKPSVGLFFIQQHTQNAVPNVIKLKKNVVEKSHEIILHTEDLEDSVTMVRSMKEFGFPIADEMIRDIKKSLVTMTTKRSIRGLIHQSTSNFQTEGASYLGKTYAQEGSEKRGNYFSSVLKSAKQKASSLRWPQLDASGLIDSKGEKAKPYTNPPLSVTSGSTGSSLKGIEIDELPLSSQVEEEFQPDERSEISERGNKLLPVSEKHDDYKANKDAQLQEWLGGTGNFDDCRAGDTSRL